MGIKKSVFHITGWNISLVVREWSVRRIQLSRTFALFSLLFFFSSTLSVKADAMMKPIPLDSALRYGILENGLTYYIRHNDVVPNRADFYIAQNVGAILEEDNQNGLAHFLEHMAFNGTKNFPDKQIINYLESIGVQFGSNINAYTSLDETVYNMKSVPTNRSGIVDTALLVLHDWSGFISLKNEEIDKERGVIREEWRTRMNANRRLWKASLPILYPNSQYAKRDVIGDTAIINNFAYDTLRAYYKRWYRPDLQAIVVVGDINVDSVETLIKSMWQDIPRRQHPDERITYPVQPNDEPLVAILTDEEAKSSRIQIEYRHEPMPDRIKASVTGYVVSVVQSLIINMISDRLDEIAAKSESPFAAGYTGYSEDVRPIDVFMLMVVPKEGYEKDAFSAMLKEAERINRYGFSKQEVDRAKLNLLSSYEKAYNERSKTKNDSYVQEYIRNYLDFEPVPGIEWEYDCVKGLSDMINVDMVNELAKKFVTERNIAVLMTGSQKEEVKFPTVEETKEMIKNSAKMEVAPYEEKSLDTNLVDGKIKSNKVKKTVQNSVLDGVTEWTLGNGIQVILKPTKLKDDEILVCGYSYGGLSKVEDADLPSAAICTNIARQNGMGKFGRIDLLKVLAGKYVSLKPSVGTYDESFDGGATVKDFETLLQMIYLTFVDPRKDDDSFNALMDQYRAILANEEKDPMRAFQDSIRTTVYNHHPRNFSMNKKRLEEVSQEVALNVFDKRFENPADFKVFIVGNINLVSMKPLIEKYLGGIPVCKKCKTEERQDRGIRTQKGKVENKFIRDMQIHKASNYVLFSGSAKYSMKNSLILRMVADILDIRYFESMREMEGGTYGVNTQSSFSLFPVEEAKLQMTFDTDPKMEEKLMSLIHEEIGRLILDGPQEEDFNKVKKNLHNKYIDNQKENGWVLNTLLFYYRDGVNRYSEYLPALDSITKDDVRSMLKSIVDQGNEIKVIMSPSK